MGVCKKIGLDPATTTLFDYLQADDKLIGGRPFIISLSWLCRRLHSRPGLVQRWYSWRHAGPARRIRGCSGNIAALWVLRVGQITIRRGQGSLHPLSLNAPFLHRPSVRAWSVRYSFDNEILHRLRRRGLFGMISRSHLSKNCHAGLSTQPPLNPHPRSGGVGCARSHSVFS